MTAKSIALFIAAAICEIGGAYLMWQAVKEQRGLLFALAGQWPSSATAPSPLFSRTRTSVASSRHTAACSSSARWRGVSSSTGSPDRYDIAGAAVCLVGVAVIMYAPR